MAIPMGRDRLTVKPPILVPLSSLGTTTWGSCPDRAGWLLAWGLSAYLGGCFGEQISNCLIDDGRAKQQDWFRELKIADHVLDAAGLYGHGWQLPSR